jgi:hypothetical protein
LTREVKLKLKFAGRADARTLEGPDGARDFQFTLGDTALAAHDARLTSDGLIPCVLFLCGFL